MLACMKKFQVGTVLQEEEPEVEHLHAEAEERGRGRRPQRKPGMEFHPREDDIYTVLIYI
mgnify:CR=1 FL=1